MYCYEHQKAQVLTPDGQKMLFQIQATMQRLTGLAGAVTVDKAMSGISGDSWTMLACIDYLCEMKQFKYVYQQGWAQGHVLKRM